MDEKQKTFMCFLCTEETKNRKEYYRLIYEKPKSYTCVRCGMIGGTNTATAARPAEAGLGNSPDVLPAKWANT